MRRIVSATSENFTPLLDENLSRRIVPFLQDAYTDSTQIALLGMETATDLEVWTFAKEHDYVIVSKDSDFYDLSLVMGIPPRVIWIRTGNVTKSAITHLLIQNREKLESFFFDEQMACVELY